MLGLKNSVRQVLCS